MIVFEFVLLDLELDTLVIAAHALLQGKKASLECLKGLNCTVACHS